MMRQATVLMIIVAAPHCRVNTTGRHVMQHLLGLCQSSRARSQQVVREKNDGIAMSYVESCWGVNVTTFVVSSFIFCSRHWRF